MQFPDRSPRPQVSFNSLSNWNFSHRKITENTILYLTDNEKELKEKLLSDWQDVLSNRWVDILFEFNTTKRNEPWFNNNLRKFILRFLEKYDTLSDEEKNNFKNTIESLIQKQ